MIHLVELSDPGEMSSAIVFNRDSSKYVRRTLFLDDCQLSGMCCVTTQERISHCNPLSEEVIDFQMFQFIICSFSFYLEFDMKWLCLM